MEDLLPYVARGLFSLVLICGVIWIAYRALMKLLVFVRALTRPARRAVRSVVDPLERKAAAHVANAFDEAGMSGAAATTRGLPDAVASAEAAVGRHLDKHAAPKG